MDLLTSIKDTVPDTVTGNLAGFLGEDINGTKVGLDLGISTFLAGVIKFASSDKTGRNLLSILNDGGHTGDILNNLETFSGNPEKTRLLETIGGNIVNHFLKDKPAGLIDKIAAQAGIKNSSSITLLHLAAPLVLGFLGKTVRQENMSALDLKAALAGATADVSASLPSALLNSLNLPKFNRGKNSPLSHYKAVKELNNDEKRKGENWSMILPWVLLFFVGVMIWYFSRSKERVGVPAVTDTVHPEIFLPLDSTSGPASETSVPPAGTVPASVDTVRLPVVQNAEKENRKEPEAQNQQEEPSGDTTPTGMTQVPASVFARNSAEVVSGSVLDQLLASLKEGRRKLVISPLRGSGSMAVDRAYAIRDYLLENGIELSQVEITSTRKGDNPSGVAYRINN